MTPLRARARAPYPWEQLDDEALLRLRFRDLGLKIATSPVYADIVRLGEQLERRGIRFKPHFWFSTDWFSPDGVPGIAVPFFLGHPRLLRLERRMLGEAEGSRRPWRMRLLRHELGHAVDTAFGLRRRRDLRNVFGAASKPYPRGYVVRPRSRNYVLHLEQWYAQSHPTEDFAETFAVWLQPKARWRAAYAGWPALAKLEFVDRLMSELARSKPSNRDRSVMAPLTDNNRTLKEYYRRRATLHADRAHRYDAWLVQAFAPRDASVNVSLESVLRDCKHELMRRLVHTGAHPYVVRQVLRAIRRRARHLDLALHGTRHAAVDRLVRLHERVLTDFLRRNEETYFL